MEQGVLALKWNYAPVVNHAYAIVSIYLSDVYQLMLLQAGSKLFGNLSI